MKAETQRRQTVYEPIDWHLNKVPPDDGCRKHSYAGQYECNKNCRCIAIAVHQTVNDAATEDSKQRVMQDIYPE